MKKQSNLNAAQEAGSLDRLVRPLKPTTDKEFLSASKVVSRYMMEHPKIQKLVFTREPQAMDMIVELRPNNGDKP